MTAASVSSFTTLSSDVQQVKPRLFLIDYRMYPTAGLALYDQLHAIAGLEGIPAIITTTDFERHRREVEQSMRCLANGSSFL